LPIIIENETAIPSEAKDMAALLGRQIADFDAKIKEIEAKLTAAHKANAVSQCLATIPGVGPVTALTLATEIDAGTFESGSHLAAWAGLTPQEHSTGGKQRMGGISLAGNERLRVLLVSSATSVINAAATTGISRQPPTARWCQGKELNKITIGRADDIQRTCSVPRLSKQLHCLELDHEPHLGQRSWRRVKQAGHMIPIDPPVRLLIFSLASQGPSTHGTEGRLLRSTPGAAHFCFATARSSQIQATREPAG
jgi:hypothetical protein